MFADPARRRFLMVVATHDGARPRTHPPHTQGGGGGQTLADEIRARVADGTLRAADGAGGAGAGGDGDPWSRVVMPAMRRLVLSTLRASSNHLRKVRARALASESGFDTSSNTSDSIPICHHRTPSAQGGRARVRHLG